MAERRRPGSVRDVVLKVVRDHGKDGVDVQTVLEKARQDLGEDLASSSVRSYLRLNTPGTFERIGRGRYRLAAR